MLDIFLKLINILENLNEIKELGKLKWSLKRVYVKNRNDEEHMVRYINNVGTLYNYHTEKVKDLIRKRIVYSKVLIEEIETLKKY